MDPASLLPEGLAAQVEATLGARIVGVKPRGGGGASRDGAELELEYPGASRRRAYMNYDVLKGGAGDDAAFLREAAILEALSGPLAGSGVTTAPFMGAIPESRALIGGYVAGDANFRGLTGPDRDAVAADFMAQLAALHAIDPRETPIAAMGPLRPPSEEVRETIAALRHRSLAFGYDPLNLYALEWLEQNIPSDPERSVIVHGDAGPGNFLYSNGKVSALLDWELVHYGDPMADLAMLCLRSLIQPFIDLPTAFGAYEAAGGAKVDLDKIRFYRVYFQARFSGNAAKFYDPSAPPPPVAGTSLVYSIMHRRVLKEALAEAEGIELGPVTLPEAPTPRSDRTFALALDDLREFIVPRLDQQASAKAKGLVRLIKWWRNLERYRAAFEAQEVEETATALGRPFADVGAARKALAEAILARSVDGRTVLRLCHSVTARETALMAESMGALADSHFAPLS